MKVCILTQPLHKNYGGLLQAYALQKVLSDAGHEVYTADIPFKKPKMFGIPSFIKACINRYIFKNEVSRLLPVSKSEKSNIQKETNKFINNRLQLTKRIPSVNQISKLDSYNFDAFIVGSDQVWRPVYSPGIMTYFFDFLDGKNGTIRLSYAASFGVDNTLEYSTKQIVRASSLLKQFNVVTVRESSAVELCETTFGIKAQHVVDPTLLLTTSDYINLVQLDDGEVLPSNGDLFVYVLDQKENKRKIIDFVRDITNLQEFTVLPSTPYETYPAVTQWIRGFMDAKYVVTDSFHGVAFCIIFNIPFIAIGNESRGLARFTSLLSKFGLMDRLVTNLDDVSIELVKQDIDFESVNIIREQELRLSKSILNAALNK